MTTTRPSAAQRAAALLLLTYSVAVTILAMPKEVLPDAVHKKTQATRDKLDKLGINPWHFVFPGRRDHQKRRHIATRYVGVTTSGQKVVLHEGPEGLTNPPVRLFDSIKDTASHKILTMAHGGPLMRFRDDEVWAKRYDAFLESRRPHKLMQAFCESAVLNGGREMDSVVMELFTAGIDYNTGEQYGRALRVGRLHCKSSTYSRAHGTPDTLPDWPGVVWQVMQ